MACPCLYTIYFLYKFSFGKEVLNYLKLRKGIKTKTNYIYADIVMGISFQVLLKDTNFDRCKHLMRLPRELGLP